MMDDGWLRFRYMRARRQHAAAEDPAALLNFSRFLLKASEHTWGSDGRCMEPHAGGDVTSWSNEAFEKARPPSKPPQQYLWDLTYVLRISLYTIHDLILMRKYVWDSHTFYANPCILRAQFESHHDDMMMTEGTHCLFGLINWFYSVVWISEQVRPTHLFKQQEDAWHEQRAYFTHALAALGPSSRVRV